MYTTENNYAFIDAQNLNRSIARQGWKVDMRRFRIFLKERHRVSRAFLCTGFLKEMSDMYDFWKRAGYELIFKEAFRATDGSVKGNCDAELVLEAALRLRQYDRAVIVTGDGDIACLVRHLRQKNKLERLLVPHKQEYSFLLRKAAGKSIAFISDQRALLELKSGETLKKKDPSGTEPEGGLFVSI